MGYAVDFQGAQQTPHGTGSPDLLTKRSIGSFFGEGRGLLLFLKSQGN